MINQLHLDKCLPGGPRSSLKAFHPVQSPSPRARATAGLRPKTVTTNEMKDVTNPEPLHDETWSRSIITTLSIRTGDYGGGLKLLHP